MLNIKITQDDKVVFDKDAKIIVAQICLTGSQESQHEIACLNIADDSNGADMIATLVSMDQTKAEILKNPIIAIGYAMKGDLFSDQITIDKSAIERMRNNLGAPFEE